MIYHISGSDCTCKTSLCNKLKNNLKLNVVHFDKPKNMEDGKQQYFNFLNNLKESVICDRFHDGEYIYAPLYRGYTADYLLEFEKELRKYPYLFVNTVSDIKIVIDRAMSRGEDFVKFDDFNKVLQLFGDYLRMQNMPYLKLDTSNSTIENNVLDNYCNEIIKYGELIKELFEKNINNDIYFGNLKAKYIIYADNYSELLRRKSIILNADKKYNQINYEEYWFTTVKNKEFFEYQQKLILNI